MDFFGERSETKKIEGKSETEVMEVIRNELEEYWLTKYILYCCENLRQIFQETNQQKTALRRRPRLQRREYFTLGQNFFQHIATFNKHKALDFSIYSSIDGFSRKLIWLELGTANKITQVIARYYFDLVKALAQTFDSKPDNGAEDAQVEPIYIFLSDLSGEVEGCFYYF